MAQAKPDKTQAPAQMEEILPQTITVALNNATPDQLIGATPGAEVIKGNTHGPVAWRHAPALLQFLATADRRLTKVARQSGINVPKVERLHAYLLKGTQLLILKPAPSTDTTAYEVKRFTRSGAWVNLFPLLGETKYTIETGWKDRFDVAFIPETSPLWPGLIIDLNSPKERRSESKKDKAEA